MNMKNEFWNPWKTGFWFYKYRWGPPAVYISKKKGFKWGKLNNCTKFKNEESARKHYMNNSLELTLEYQEPMNDYLFEYLRIK